MGVRSKPVRYPQDLEGLSGIVLPGGESTTMGMLLDRHELFLPLKRALDAGLPAFGTCAGAILLATDIADSDQPRFGAIDMTVGRNAYGSQVDSFETRVLFEGAEIDAVFIRAPKFLRLGAGVTVLASHRDEPVLVRSKSVLACAFHPELTADESVHRYFVDRVVQSQV
jgi:pyridoxal 5'-phosphate synthase pdxT subunit